MSNLISPMERVLKESIYNIYSEMLCILQSIKLNQNDYAILQSAVLLNHLLELNKTYYVYSKNKNYQGEICSYSEYKQFSDTICIDKKSGRYDIIINDSDDCDSLRVSERKIKPILIVTIASTLYRLGLFEQSDGMYSFLQKVTIRRNKCVHSITNIYNTMFESINFLKDFNTIFDLTFDLICHEVKINTPKRDDIITVISEYLYNLIEIDSHLFINKMVNITNQLEDNIKISDLLYEIDNLIINIEDTILQIKSDETQLYLNDISTSSIEFGQQF